MKTPEQIKIGRLQKKIRKLIQQREHFKEQCDFLDKVLRYYPYAQKTHDDRMRNDANRRRLEELELIQTAILKQNQEMKKKLEKYNEST